MCRQGMELVLGDCVDHGRDSWEITGTVMGYPADDGEILVMVSAYDFRVCNVADLTHMMIEMPMEPDTSLGW